MHADASSAYFSLFLSNAAHLPMAQLVRPWWQSSWWWARLQWQVEEMLWQSAVGTSAGDQDWLSDPTRLPPGDNRNLSHTKLLSASPSCLTNWISWYAVDMLALFTSSLRVSMTFTSFHRTRSWRHLYRPWARAVLQPERMCCRLELWWPQGWQISSIPYQWCRFWGLGRVSYVALIRKLNLAWGSFHRSAHVMFLSITASQVVHFPRWDWLTALTL